MELVVTNSIWPYHQNRSHIDCIFKLRINNQCYDQIPNDLTCRVMVDIDILEKWDPDLSERIKMDNSAEKLTLEWVLLKKALDTIKRYIQAGSPLISNCYIHLNNQNGPHFYDLGWYCDDYVRGYELVYDCSDIHNETIITIENLQGLILHPG